MPQELVAVEFNATLIDKVRDFHCGNEPWEFAISEWIKSERPLQQSLERGTKIWLYYSPNDDLVGYGSLGKTRRKWPPPSGEYVNLSIIPSLGVQKPFQGEPKDDPPRFSEQIMLDLIAKAREHGTQLLILDVHQENQRAIAFYEKFEFFSAEYSKDEYIRMYHRLG